MKSDVQKRQVTEITYVLSLSEQEYEAVWDAVMQVAKHRASDETHLAVAARLYQELPTPPSQDIPF